MTIITEEMRYRQGLCEYALKHGVTKAARRYHTYHQFVYRQLDRYDRKSWKGFKSIGLEKKTIKRNNGTIINEERYFICSIDDIGMFGRAVREHWGVENGLHWHLDFTFKDDKNTTMSKTGAKNLQIMKKIPYDLY